MHGSKKQLQEKVLQILSQNRNVTSVSSCRTTSGRQTDRRTTSNRMTAAAFGVDSTWICGVITETHKPPPLLMTLSEVTVRLYGLFSPPIPEPSRPFIWSVKGNCCKSNGTSSSSSGTKTSPRQLAFHPSLIQSVFGHVARLPDDVPAHKALNCHINLSLGRPPSSQWQLPPMPSPVADGSINSGQITTFHLQTSGGVLSTVVTEEWRYGPCRLIDNINNKPCIRWDTCGRARSGNWALCSEHGLQTRSPSPARTCGPRTGPKDHAPTLPATWRHFRFQWSRSVYEGRGRWCRLCGWPPVP